MMSHHACLIYTTKKDFLFGLSVSITYNKPNFRGMNKIKFRLQCAISSWSPLVWLLWKAAFVGFVLTNLSQAKWCHIFWNLSLTYLRRETVSGVVAVECFLWGFCPGTCCSWEVEERNVEHIWLLNISHSQQLASMA